MPPPEAKSNENVKDNATQLPTSTSTFSGFLTYFTFFKAPADTETLDAAVDDTPGAPGSLDDYQQRLDNYLKLHKHMRNIQKKYEVKRKSEGGFLSKISWSAPERYESFKFIESVTQTLPTVFGPDKKEIASCHAVLLGVCILEREKIKAPYDNAWWDSNAANSILFCIVNSHVSHLKKEEKLTALLALKNHLQSPRCDKVIEYDKLGEVALLAMLDEHIEKSASHVSLTL